MTEELSLLLRPGTQVGLLKITGTLLLPSHVSYNNLPVSEPWSFCVTIGPCTTLCNFTQLSLHREHGDVSSSNLNNDTSGFIM